MESSIRDLLIPVLRSTASELKIGMKAAGLKIKSIDDRIRASDTGGAYSRIAQFGNGELQVYYDHYSGRNYPMLWIGFCFSTTDDLNTMISMASESAKPKTEIDDDHYEFVGDAYRLKSPLTGAQLSCSIVEKYPQNEGWRYFLGRYFVEYTGEDAVSYVKELLGIPSSLPERFWEGEVSQKTSNIYERDPAARAACIKKYGYVCIVCKLDFADRYGKLGREFIHVHHMLPLAARDGVGAPTLLGELVTVCPNCHAMLHRFGLRSPDDLREIIWKRDQNRQGPTPTLPTADR